MALKSLTYEDPLFQLLRDGNVKEFNRRKGERQSIALTDCDFRHLDLRGLDAAAVDFSNSYFRGADLRAIDFSKARLEGASLNGARISGVLFPADLAPQKIALSVDHGTRLRYRRQRTEIACPLNSTIASENHRCSCSWLVFVVGARSSFYDEHER